MDVITKLVETKLLPLYTATRLDCLDTVEKVLLNNKIKMIEVTYRSQLASQAIQALAASGRLVVGAGTVRSLSQAKEAVANGAKFIVTPGIVEEVLEYCAQNQIACLPGVATPSEIQIGLRYGISVFKLFPVNLYGGLNAVKALSGPYFDIHFLPTGGIDESNYVTYLAHPAVAAVGGSFILSEKQILLDGGVTSDKHLKSLLLGMGHEQKNSH